jgi:cell division septal protein FtsQ
LKKPMASVKKEIFIKNTKGNRKKVSWRQVAKKVAYWLLFLSFLGLAFWMVFLSNLMVVSRIDVNTDDDNGRQAKEMIQSEIRGKFFNLLPKNNLLLVSRGKLVRDLKLKDRNIKEVSIEKIFPNILKTEIVQRQPRLIWCRKSCYLVDDQGQAYFQISGGDELPEENSLLKIVDDSDGEISTGDVVVSREKVDFLSQLPEKIREKTGIEVANDAQIPSFMSDEVHLTTVSGWTIFFSLQQPLELQTSILEKILKDNIPQDKIEQLEYIDLRIRGRAIYKLKQEEEKTGENNEGEENEKNDPNRTELEKPASTEDKKINI